MGFANRPDSEENASHCVQTDKWREAAESLAGLLWICDETGQIETLVRFGSPAAGQASEGAASPAIGGHWVELLADCCKEQALLDWRISQTEKTPFSGWLQFASAQAPPRCYLTRLLLSKTEGASGSGWLGLALDVQSLREMRLSATEPGSKTDLFELAAKATNDVLWDWDLKTQALWWGDTFYSKFGYTREETSPDISSWKTRIHPEDLERVTQGIEDAIRHRKENWEAAYRFRLSSGEYAIIHDRGYIKVNAAGSPERMVGAMIDITKETRAREEILRLNREMKQHIARRDIEIAAATSALEAFSYSVSHDLRAPIRHIISFAELLNRSNSDRLNEDGLRYLARIVESGQRMRELIEALLELSRLGRVKMQGSQLNLTSMVETIQRDFSVDLSGRRIEWTIHPLPNPWGDEILIRQVFVNLIDNAVKYTRTRKVALIEIGAEDRGNAWELFVRDNGVGFDMKYSNRLFQVFQRLHSETEFEGFGVGLANVNQIIGLHGGRVWAEAEPDKGTTIFFTLPKSNPLSNSKGAPSEQLHINP